MAFPSDKKASAGCTTAARFIELASDDLGKDRRVIDTFAAHLEYLMHYYSLYDEDGSLIHNAFAIALDRFEDAMEEEATIRGYAVCKEPGIRLWYIINKEDFRRAGEMAKPVPSKVAVTDNAYTSLFSALRVAVKLPPR